MFNFLKNNTGFKMAAVKEGGSGGKQTNTRDSDLDIIFYTPKDQNKTEVKKELLEKAKQNFGKVAKIYPGKKAVHADFKNPLCNVDLVYLTKREFQQENKKIQKIKKIRPLHKNAIKLAKFAISRAKINNVKGYEVELACVRLNNNNLADCVYNLINYFSGRIKKKGTSVNNVLKFLR